VVTMKERSLSMQSFLCPSFLSHLLVCDIVCTDVAMKAAAF
jgi:hypothetical protein